MLTSPDFKEMLRLLESDEVRFEPIAGIYLSLIKGKLVVTPRPKPKYFLEQLVKDITEDNKHAGIDTGEPLGNEAW